MAYQCYAGINFPSFSAIPSSEMNNHTFYVKMAEISDSAKIYFASPSALPGFALTNIDLLAWYIRLCESLLESLCLVLYALGWICGVQSLADGH